MVPKAGHKIINRSSQEYLSATYVGNIDYYSVLKWGQLQSTDVSKSDSNHSSCRGIDLGYSKPFPA